MEASKKQTDLALPENCKGIRVCAEDENKNWAVFDVPENCRSILICTDAELYDQRVKDGYIPLFDDRGLDPKDRVPCYLGYSPIPMQQMSIEAVVRPCVATKSQSPPAATGELWEDGVNSRTVCEHFGYAEEYEAIQARHHGYWPLGLVMRRISELPNFIKAAELDKKKFQIVLDYDPEFPRAMIQFRKYDTNNPQGLPRPL